MQSTLAAETLSATKAVDQAYHIGTILSQLIFDSSTCRIPIELYTDNHSMYDNIYSTKNVAEKRLRIDIAVLKQMVDERTLKVIWVETGHQIADVFTKRGVNPAKIVQTIDEGLSM